MTLLDQPDPIDRFRYPLDEWRIIETKPSRGRTLGVTETVFALGNGYLGMRGNPEEGRETYAHGTFINGFHETWPIHHAEAAYGFATTGQTIVNVPDAKVIKLYVNDEPLNISTADLDQYSRVLDLRDGVLRRELIWRTPSGLHVQVRSTRLVSFADRHLSTMTYEVTLLDGDAPVVISSQVINRQDGTDDYRGTTTALGEGFDPRKASHFEHRVLEPELHGETERRMIFGYRTANSGMTLAVAVDHVLTGVDDPDTVSACEEDRGRKVYRLRATQGQTIRLTKTVAYHTSSGIPAGELVDRCRRTLDRVLQSGIASVFDDQRAWLDDFWSTTDVVIEGQPAIQQATRWCLFQVAQAAARADQLGIAAKGVTGSGYEGHAFWDTEAYIIPFLAYTNPVVARNALRYRVTLLGAARRRARELNEPGALFPWRTINGEEASAYYAAGTAQYHIDADIAWAFTMYTDVTGDWEFMYRDGVRVLVETARMWEGLGFWSVNGSRRFQIHSVTGPDEYTTVVNNNMFTNVMARHNLWSAASIMRRMQAEVPQRYAGLVAELGVAEGEIDAWAECANGMYIPFDEETGIHPQDEHFLEREVWDLDATPRENYPLLLHYHPLVLYRRQVLKQADVVMATFLQGQHFSDEAKRADFDYYDPITTGDSSLSAVVQSIMASEVGYSDLALRYFLSGLFVDLLDLHENADDGVHIASAAGVWTTLVSGFAGLREVDGHLSFDPRLPRTWPALEFPLRMRGSRFRVRLESDAMIFTLIEGDAVQVSVRGQSITIGADPTRVALDGQGPDLAWEGRARDPFVDIHGQRRDRPVERDGV
ncbi:MAG: glycoside hydrolase family 65 protein [Propioniciclava sp.]